MKCFIHSMYNDHMYYILITCVYIYVYMHMDVDCEGPDLWRTLTQTCFNLCSKGSLVVLWIGRASSRSQAGKMKVTPGRNDGSFDASKYRC